MKNFLPGKFDAFGLFCSNVDTSLQQNLEKTVKYCQINVLLNRLWRERWIFSSKMDDSICITIFSSIKDFGWRRGFQCFSCHKPSKISVRLFLKNFYWLSFALENFLHPLDGKMKNFLLCLTSDLSTFYPNLYQKKLMKYFLNLSSWHLFWCEYFKGSLEPLFNFFVAYLNFYTILFHYKTNILPLISTNLYLKFFNVPCT